MLKENGMKEGYYGVRKREEITDRNGEMGGDRIGKVLEDCCVWEWDIELLGCGR